MLEKWVKQNKEYIVSVLGMNASFIQKPFVSTFSRYPNNTSKSSTPFLYTFSGYRATSISWFPVHPVWFYKPGTKPDEQAMIAGFFLIYLGEMNGLHISQQ